MAETPPSRRQTPQGDSASSRRAPGGRWRARLIKIAVALVLVGGLGVLFVRSAHDTRATPYTIAAADMRGWTLTLEPEGGPTDPLLVLRPPARLAGALFHQIFTRAMESLNTPAAPVIPLLLRGEFDRAFAGRVTAEDLLAAARSAGLDATAFKPACLGYRRASDVNANQQLYFALFDSAAFGQFRERMATMRHAGPGDGGEYDPSSLSPLLFVAAAETRFNQWLPLRADPKTDCVAPIVISPT